MQISVVVVTWNGLRLLQPCVAALEAQTVSFELVVVDNGSSDGTVEWVRQQSTPIKLIPIADNQGFAQGNNIGIQQCSGNAIILINNDTVPPPSFIDHLSRPLVESEDIGAVAGVLVFAHRQHVIASAGIVPGMDGVHRDKDALLTVASLPEQPLEIFGPSGGAVCFRRAALDDVGLFDAGYFNYLEDADLAWRLRLRGWKTLLAPDARISHVYSATSGHASPMKQRLLARNRLRVLLRCWPTSILQKYGMKIARYDLLAIAYGMVTRQFQVVQGRLNAFRQLPSILNERRQLQHLATADPDDLARWLTPPLSIRAVMDESKRLDRILRER